MRTPVAWLATTLLAVMEQSGAARLPLELRAECAVHGSVVNLRLVVRNTGVAPLWIGEDTEPWSPSYISNRFYAETVKDGVSLRGPIAFGHSIHAVKVPSNGEVAGDVQLTAAFPELGTVLKSQAVRVKWRWQGLVSFSEYFESFTPSSTFEGVVMIDDKRCSGLSVGPV